MWIILTLYIILNLCIWYKEIIKGKDFKNPIIGRKYSIVQFTIELVLFLIFGLAYVLTDYFNSKDEYDEYDEF